MIKTWSSSSPRPAALPPAITQNHITKVNAMRIDPLQKATLVQALEAEQKKIDHCGAYTQACQSRLHAAQLELQAHELAKISISRLIRLFEDDLSEDAE